MATEVESRYLVPDRALFRRLRQLDRLGAYALSVEGTARITDHYLDTRGRALLRQGWACRLRAQKGAWLLTLKGPANVNGAILSRPELEIPLPDRIQDVAHWPKGQIRTQVQALTSGLPLQKLVTIRQTRHRLAAVDDDRHCAQVSLDSVRIQGKGLRQQSYMIECELTEQGDVRDLEILDRWLVGDLGLIPETRSKLRRALELVEQGGSPDAESLRSPDPITAEALCQRYDVDLERASRVAALCGRLFEMLEPWHELPATRGALLHVAATLHDTGRHAGPKQHHIVGRDILLRQPILGLDEDEQRVVAASAYLSDEDVTSDRLRDVVPETVAPALRLESLAIAALVRLARALDAPAGSEVELLEVTEAHGALTISLAGKGAGKSAREASQRADLWNARFDTPLLFASQGRRPTASLGDSAVGIAPADTMHQALGKIMDFHLGRMLAHEEGTRLGEDPEELHDMRVATRRMRSALRLFGPYVVTGPLVQRPGAGLRRIASVLGAVRDMDIALQRAQAFGEAASFQGTLEPLLRTLRRRRAVARRQLLRYLDSRAYEVLLRDLQGLVAALSASPPAEKKRERVLYIAPRLLYVDYGNVRAYRAVVVDAPIPLLHALRIDCKRLRYALEFFAEILPQEVVETIPTVVALQDHLGEMHDAAIVVETIDALLAKRKYPQRLVGVLAYREACDTEMRQRLRTFPKAWRRFIRQRLHKHLEKLVQD